MKAKAVKLVLFLSALAFLQQAIAWSNAHVARLERQSELVRDNDIDPSALFYTEIPMALGAEKAVRRRLQD